MRWEVTNENQLREIAQILHKQLRFPVILFQGEMGAGKTTFIKYLVEAMGGQELVNSPTFSLVNEYETDHGRVFHFDFYRIESEEEAFDMGAEEYFYSGNFCFIEWPERVKNLLPKEYHCVSIATENTKRIINLER
ncbi:tRNA (adenosine(37)-N6)-threonylcarbamoyltransferase complex ATPase subunit type 1 TsaE [Candidatus Ornithobacterium hominis]|uniref:tRNA (adenosine(37)-N6)-threonylcarbamoyltransferase complex ATPase subunit type 1 TsaE n=1 Tax=Candidatus Ornithobacterium hominis TaxID=2497989 RepID=UPI0024BC8C20|nr:tRNA (adenosine(37)-N6)-threonylcarbamoyltransferase complex ATPase subunit type 1 TsaE [Candidatus Ornithobacterium hominis]CAI9428743.1 tRNA (adenosine(37)-N6)-threonylcarbamoyltransferase complex ATPase subunit type 1 TsaE [Candidatus Ornithobacterium hominis]